MAENKRARIEPHIEDYLKSQAERVMGKPTSNLTGAELSTVANAIIYEHKLAQSMAKQIPFAKLFNWLTSWVPGSGGKVLQFQSTTIPALSAPQQQVEDFELDAELGDLYEEDAA